MALEEAPPFWWENPGWQAWLLGPLGFAYGQVSSKRMNFSPSLSVDVPVLCIGNFITGGAGKTPTAIRFAKHIRKQGSKPGILSRGWGGSVNSPTVVKNDHHNAHDVGDEALLHAANAVTVVSSDRTAGAKLLLEQGCDFIIMDDGFQNPSLLKDYNLVVVDAKRGLGNGFYDACPAHLGFRFPNSFIMLTVVLDDRGGRNAARRLSARQPGPANRFSLVSCPSSARQNSRSLTCWLLRGLVILTNSMKRLNRLGPT